MCNILPDALYKEKTPDVFYGGNGSVTRWTISYHSLVMYTGRNFGSNADFKPGGVGKKYEYSSRTTPGTFGALDSRLYPLLADGKHHGVKLSAEEMERLVIWMDLNSNFLGHYLFTGEQSRGILPALPPTDYFDASDHPEARIPTTAQRKANQMFARALLLVSIALLVAQALASFASAVETGAAPAIRHRFLAVDESRKQLHFVDENDRSSDWSVAGNFRDLQLIGDFRVALSDGEGVTIVDLKTKRIVAKIHSASARGTQSFRWQPDGRILVVAGGGVVTLDALGTNLGKVPRSLGGRICRTTSDGGWVSGVGTDLVDLAPDGTVRAKLSVRGIKHFYQVAKRADGGYFGTCGYDAVAVSLDAKGTELRRFEYPQKYFFASLQVLANGNLVVANWAGHGKDDVRNERKGPQAIEFTPDGKVVWTFRDPEKLGSIHYVLVVDDLNLALPHHDAGGRHLPMPDITLPVIAKP